MTTPYKYFKDLFGYCQEKDAWVEIRPLGGEGTPDGPRAPHKRIKGTRFLFPVKEFLKEETFKKIEAWATRLNTAGWDIYYGVLPRDEEGNPITDGICVLYQDIDFKTEDPLELKELMKAYDEIEKDYGIVIGGDNSNCWVIGSGRGQHHIFVLDKELTEEEWRRFNTILYKIYRVKRLPADEKVAKDAARILRFPNTFNLKYEDKPQAVILSEQKLPLDLKRLELAERKLYEEEEDEREISAVARFNEIDILPEGELGEERIKKIARLLVPYWRKGHRHGLLLGLLGYLIKAGVSKEDARAIVETIVEEAKDEEAEQRLYMVDYHYEKRVKEKKPEELVGLTQIRQELRRQGVQEGSINSIVLKIQELVNRYELYNIYTRIKVSRPRGGFANVVSMRGIYWWKEVKNEYDDEYDVILDRKVVGAALVRVKIIRNPYTGNKEIEAIFLTEANRKLSVRGTFWEIFSRLQSENLILSKQRGEEALHSILLAVERKGLAKVKDDIEVEGFFINAEGLLEAKWEFPRYERERVKEALLVLDEFVQRFARQYPHKASEVIKNVVMAPFNFARKQLGLESWKWLILIGYGGTGKTTLSSLAGHIWGLPRTFEISAGSLSTEARVGRIFSRWTFPFVVNEVQELFHKDSKVAIRDLLKNAWSSITVRGKYRAGEWVEELALASLLMTSNQDVDLTSAEQRRYKKIEFFSSEKPSPEQKREFNEWKRHLRLLTHLAYPIYTYIKEHPELLKVEDYNDAGETVLRALYEEYVGRVPDWVGLKVEEEIEHDILVKENLREDVVMALTEYINEKAARYRVEPFVQKTEPIHPVLARLRELNRKGYETTVIYNEEGGELLVRKQFLRYLKERGIEIATLDDLAEILGGEKKKITRRKLGLVAIEAAVLDASTLFTAEIPAHLAMEIYAAYRNDREEGVIEMEEFEELLKKDELTEEDKEKAKEVLIRLILNECENLRECEEVVEEFDRGELSFQQALVAVWRKRARWSDSSDGGDGGDRERDDIVEGF